MNCLFIQHMYLLLLVSSMYVTWVLLNKCGRLIHMCSGLLQIYLCENCTLNNLQKIIY